MFLHSVLPSVGQVRLHIQRWFNCQAYVNTITTYCSVVLFFHSATTAPYDIGWIWRSNLAHDIPLSIYIIFEALCTTIWLSQDDTRLCDAISLQFGKIITSAKENTQSSTKRAIKYAEAGVCFSNKMRRLHSVDESDDDVTPIESAIDEKQSDDLAFVVKWRQNHVGRMNWSNCYDDGRKANFFHRYKSHLTLKQAFNERTL